MRNRTKRKTRKSTLAGYLLVDLIIILMIALNFMSGNPFKGLGESPHIIQHPIEGQYSIDGQTWVNLRDGIPAGTERVEIKGTFGLTEKSATNLHIIVDNLRLDVSINGKKVASFGQVGTYPSFSKGTGRAVLTLEGVRATSVYELDMVIENPYPKFNPTAIEDQLDTLFFSGSDNMFLYLAKNTNWAAFLLGFVIVVVGLYTFGTMIIYIRNGYVGQYQEIKTLAAFSFYSWVCGFYVMIAGIHTVMPFVVQAPVLCNIMENTPPFFVVAASATYFCSSMEQRRLRDTMWLVCIIIYAGSAVCFILQLLGICDLYVLQMVPILLGFVACAVATPMLIYEVRKYKNRAARFVVISFIPILIGQLIGIVAIFTGSTGIGPFENRAIFTTLIIITSWAQFIRLAELSKYQAHQTAEYVLSQEELRDTRISMMMSQIQPHFLYNALNTIQYQCQVDGEQAAKTVESFSKYLRGNMDSLSQTEPIPLSQELKHLENYLAIERLRFPDIQYVYKLKASDFALPPLTIQPLVENSIRYGVRGMEEGGTITIESWEDEHNYYARVSDNGAGFDVNQKKNDGRSHVGMQNIKSRVQSMCGGHVEIESKIGAGTRSTIVIPKGGKKR